MICGICRFGQTTRLPPFTLRWTLFTVIFLGLFIPITLVQIFGAVAQSAAFAIPTWKDAALIGAPDLLFALTGSGPVARFVMVLMCFGVAANTAPTIYSCGLSGQIALPFLTRGQCFSSYLELDPRVKRMRVVLMLGCSTPISPHIRRIGSIPSDRNHRSESFLHRPVQLSRHSGLLDRHLHSSCHHRTARIPTSCFPINVSSRSME